METPNQSPSLLERVPSSAWPVAVLLSWGAALLFFGLVRFTPYGLDEGAARALLLNWSTVGQIANPVFIVGIPDFRAVLFIPLGIYWSGSIVAAKVFTILIAFAGVLLLFHWSRRRWSEELALLASGLFLVAPLTLLQIDSMDQGIYLLTLVAAGLWIDAKYRSLPRPMGGWYFTHMLLTAVIITLHPMALAYPAVLAWQWYRDPVSKKHRQHMFVGLAIATGVILAMGAGWVAIDWLVNPVLSLARVFYVFYPVDVDHDQELVLGTLCFILLLLVLLAAGRELARDTAGRMLLAALALGLLCADLAWALLAQVVIVYGGGAWLLKAAGRPALQKVFGQRGLVTGLLFLLLFWCMQMDKTYANQLANNILDPVDQLIDQLREEAADVNKPFRAASQWPSRTMIILRRDVLPLPPPMPDSQTLWNNIKMLTHVIFAHSDKGNYPLAKQLAELITVTRTEAVEAGGVIVSIKPEGAAESPAPPTPATDGASAPKP